jgi:hypothetical protein
MRKIKKQHFVPTCKSSRGHLHPLNKLYKNNRKSDRYAIKSPSTSFRHLQLLNPSMLQ